jgi:hypothetical protein
MKKIKMILEEKHPGILTYGCSTHYSNLLESKLSPTQFIGHIVEINKLFRNHQIFQAKLIESGGKIPQLPNDTLWNSQKACVSTFIENFNKYREIMLEVLTSGQGTSDVFKINKKLLDVII